MTLDIRTHQTDVIERNRVLSGNFKAFINYYIDNQKRTIDLSDQGLKKLAWDSRDELVEKKYCTRIETQAVIKRKGFDIDLAWDKNSPDLMKIFLDLQIAAYGGLNLIEKHNFDRKTNYKNVGTNLRLSAKERVKGNKSATPTSVFYNVGGNGSFYLTPEFELQIDIEHFNNQTETIRFKNVKFYKPSQGTEENNATISEGIKAFASTVETDGNAVAKPIASIAVYDLMLEMMLKKPNEIDLYKNTTINVINPDNFKLAQK